jgi:thiol-disulfide isomerase/thioredoxin
MPAPDFIVIDETNNEISLSQFIGKPVVLNFWASWCPPCKDEMPDFNKVFEESGDEIVFMMVNLTDGVRETKEKSLQYVADEGFAFPIFFDTKGEAANIYGITSIPTTIFIDKDGYIVAAAQGAINESTLRRGIGMIYWGE